MLAKIVYALALLGLAVAHHHDAFDDAASVLDNFFG